MYWVEKDKGKRIKKEEGTFQTIFLLFSCAVSTVLYPCKISVLRPQQLHALTASKNIKTTEEVIKGNWKKLVNFLMSRKKVAFVKLLILVINLLALLGV